MSRPLRRREFLARAGAALLGGDREGWSFGGPGRRVAAARVLSLLPPRASTDRITGITVCTRPRSGPAARGRAGPRQDRRSQLRARRQRLVAVLGLERHG